MRNFELYLKSNLPENTPASGPTPENPGDLGWSIRMIPEEPKDLTEKELESVLTAIIALEVDVETLLKEKQDQISNDINKEIDDLTNGS